MKVVGNKEDVNRIELSHKGLNVSFNCSMKPLPYDYNIDISKLSDSAIDEMIGALTK